MSAQPFPRGRLQSLLSKADWWLDGPILNPLRRLCGALVTAAGPWIVAIVTLILIARTTEPRLDLEALEDMRLAVVYAFMLTPMVAAPFGVIAARTITDRAAPPDTSEVGALMLVACCVAGVAAEVLAFVVAFVLGLSDLGLTVAFLILTSASAMMWTAFSILAACRAKRRLIMSFSAGMGVALLLSIVIADHARNAGDVVWCFTAGIALCFALCLAPFGPAGLEVFELRKAVTKMREGARTTWPLALGAALAIIGIWADKWVVWAGTDGQVSSAGFWHFSTYDSAMFLAQLSVVPGLAVLAIHFEEPVRHAMARFRATLARGASLDAAEGSVRALSATVWTGILRIMVAQFALSAALLLTAPVIALAAGLRLDQFLILRTGIVGALLHAIFLAASGVLILCNRKSAFLTVQTIFLLSNFGMSAALTIMYGNTAMGFAMAAATSSIVASVIAFATTKRIVRYYFLTGNDAIFETAHAVN